MEKLPETIENPKICVGKQVIELSVEKDAIPFSPEHARLALAAIEKFKQTFGEEVLEKARYGSIVSRNDPERTLKGQGRFLMNGENLVDAESKKNNVVMYNRGMDFTLPHRVSTPENFVDNFSGTIMHEITHGGQLINLFKIGRRNTQFLVEWRKEFGWKPIFANIRNPQTGEWKKSSIPPEGWKWDERNHWHNGAYAITEEEYTDLPEKCIGGSNGYAASVGPQEDICDSVTAYLLNPDALVLEKRKFIEKWLTESKKPPNA